MQMVFNEISVSKEQLNTHEANLLFSSFLQTYSEAIKSNRSISRSLATPIDFNDLEIASGYYLAHWRNSVSVDRDDKRRLLGICERQKITVPSSEDCIFVQYGDAVGKGLQIAYENQRPLISIPSAINWKQHTFQCMLYDLEHEEENEIFLKNISCIESLLVHDEWIRTEIKKEHIDIKTSDAFLSKVSILFPSLVFHRNALSQMKRQINPVNIPAIVEKLLVLERYFFAWDGGEFDLSAFPPRFISPESEATLSRFSAEHTFEWEGSSILVSYHVRYTGGNIPGRIFIYPDHSQRKCIVCSMHAKLKTVNDPKF